MDTHEEYYKSLRLKLEEFRPLLQKIIKREQVINERIELETLSLNPERLTARSGSARDERKREEGMTLRVKNLERLTKEVCICVYVWICVCVNISVCVYA